MLKASELTSTKTSIRCKLLTNQRIQLALNVSVAIFPGYRDQSTDLQYKSIDWLLCGGNIAMKKVTNGKASTSNVRKTYTR